VKLVLALLAPPAALLAVLALPAAAPAAAPLSPAPESWAVDPVHSSLVFKVQHNGVSNFYGMFKEFSGRISLDAEPSKCSVNFTVQAASVDSRNPKRDQHLNSPDFFSTKEFPTIEFKSSKVEKAGDGWSVTGQLTLHGVSKDVTVNVVQTGKVKGEKGAKAGFESHFSVKRSDYGMDWGLDNGALGDEVDVTLSVECRQE